VPLSLIFFSAVPGAALLSYAALLTITLFKGLRGPAERYFAGYLGSMMVWSLGAMMMYLDRAAAPRWNQVMMLGVAVVPFTFYGFVQGFRGRSGRQLIILLGTLIMVCMLLLGVLGYLVSDLRVDEAGFIGFVFGPGMPVFGAYYLLYLGLAGVGLLRDLGATHDFAASNRIRYILVGLGAILVGGFTNVLPGTGAVPLDIAANLANALIITYAISRYHLLDLSFIVRRGLAYSLSTAFVAAGYLVVVFLGIDLLHLVGGARFVLALVVAIAVAVALQPGRDRVQEWVDRLFFREKYDAGLILQQLSHQVARLLDLKQLAWLILDEVCNAMQVSSAALLIRDRESGEYVTLSHVERAGDDERANALAALRMRADNPITVCLAKHYDVLTARDLALRPEFKGLWAEERAALEAGSIGLFIGLTVGRELVGILMLGPKRSEATYAPDELRMLQTVANHVAVAVQNAWLYAAALEEKERAQTILQAASAGIVVADRQLRIMTMNPSAEAITGRRLEELRGRPLAELLGADSISEGKPLASALDAASSLPPTEVRVNGAGRSTDLLLKMTPLSHGFLVDFVDITRLKEVDRLKSEIVANVSHELRGPLASIMGYTQLLMEEMDGEDRAMRGSFLTVINEETDRLAGYINDMLDLSRLESGHVELVLAPASLQALAAEVARGLEVQATAAGVAIELAVPSELPEVLVDRGLVLTALKNLVGNAVKFSPRGAAVEVIGRADGERVTLEVVDHGPGIAPEDLPSLFTKFHRGRAARQAGIAGTGLGLVLARQAVEQHHGTLAVETALGRGSRFTMTLPVGEPPPPDQQPT
jgi:PAS domain S-box-containing protein